LASWDFFKLRFRWMKLGEIGDRIDWDWLEYVTLDRMGYRIG
jgi:hypothetical protein